jgi:hypothetical protein
MLNDERQMINGEPMRFIISPFIIHHFLKWG